MSRQILLFLHTYRIKEIDYGVLSAYMSAKLVRNEEIAQAAEAGIALRDRHGQPQRRLSPGTINMTLDLIGRILDEAIKRGMLKSNPAKDPTAAP